MFFLLFLLLLLPFPVLAASVQATWTDTSSGDAQEDYFVLERRLEPSGSYFDVGHPPQDSQAWIDSQVIGGNTYTWRVKAVNSIGESGYSNEATLLVQAGPGIPSVACVYNPSTPPPTGLVLAFAMNAGSGSTVADSSGNNNTGTINGATWTASGKYGAALSFNGTTAYVTVPDANSLDLTTSMTLEAWVYPTVTPTNWSAILMKQDPSEFAYALYAGSPTNRPYTMIRSGGANRQAQGSAALPLNTWSHLAGTYDGATLRLYVNGVQTGSLPYAGAAVVSGLPLAIGRNLTYQEYFTGRIDEIKIYNRALSANEIQTDMNTP